MKSRGDAEDLGIWSSIFDLSKEVYIYVFTCKNSFSYILLHIFKMYVIL